MDIEDCRLAWSSSANTGSQNLLRGWEPGYKTNTFNAVTEILPESIVPGRQDVMASQGPGYCVRAGIHSGPF